MGTAVSLKLWKALSDKGEKLSKFLPYLAYHEGTRTFLMVDQSLASIIEFEPLPAGGIDEITINNIASILENIFTYPVPPDTALQFIVYASPNVEPLIEKWASLKRGELGKTLAGIRKEFILSRKEGFFKDSPYRPLRYRYFFTLRVFYKKVPDEDEIMKFAHLREAFFTTLGSLELKPKILELKDFLSLITEILNGVPVEFSYNPKYPIRNQIVYTSLHVEKHSMTLGDRYLSVITSKLPPDNPDMRAPITGDIFNDQRRITYPFLLTVNFHIPDQEKIKASISQKQKIQTMQATGPLALFFPKVKQAAEELYYALDRAERGETFIKTYLTYVTFTKSIREAKEAENKVLTLLKLCNYVPQVETSVKATVFLKALPMAYEPYISRFLQRGKTVLSSNCPHLVPIVGDWKGTKTPAEIVFSRRGEIMYIDLFDSPGNYNCVVSAASGSGKSFFVNDLIINYLAMGGRVFVLDVGGSYEKLCENLNGEYIEFTYEKWPILNPFSSLKVEDGKIDEEDLGFVTPLIAKMAAGEERLSKVQEGELEEMIVKTVEKFGTDATISNLYDILVEHGHKDLAKMIYSYAKGKYARLFNAPATIHFDKDFVVLEMQGIRGKKDLVSVVLLMVLFHINKIITTTPRGQRKLVVIDEAWDLLSDPYSAKFIENAYRIYRKYGAAAISITQNLADLYMNESGRAVADNADFYFLLRQKPESITQLMESKKLILNEAYRDLLLSLRKVTGKYSEIFFYTPLGKGVGRFIPDPFTYWLFTTDPNDLQKIKELKQKGYSTTEAIKILAQEHEYD